MDAGRPADPPCRGQPGRNLRNHGRAHSRNMAPNLDRPRAISDPKQPLQSPKVNQGLSLPPRRVVPLLPARQGLGGRPRYPASGAARLQSSIYRGAPPRLASLSQRRRPPIPPSSPSPRTPTSARPTSARLSRRRNLPEGSYGRRNREAIAAREERVAARPRIEAQVRCSARVLTPHTRMFSWQESSPVLARWSAPGR
jgi:hypothetical protein